MTVPPAGWRRCRETCERLFAALDWEQLGDVYFHADGAESWASRREQVLDHGLALARELLQRVPAGGHSLWVGAGVAELPVLLAETQLAGRRVRATNLRARECELLAAGLRAVGCEDSVRIEAIDAVTAGTGFDHVGCISVFTDPETWPVLADVTYGRVPPVQLDVDAFAAERDRARGLAAALFGALARPGWLTTSAEEIAWFLEQAEQVGVAWEADETMVPTAVVGDPVGFVRFA